MRDRIARGKKLGIAILAMALAALLMFAACAPPSTVEENTVEFAGMVPMTGAAQASLQIQVQAVQDYIRYFNEQNGIPGVTVKFLWGDTALQLSRFVSDYEKFKARGVPIMWIMEGDPMLGFADDFAEDQIPVLGSAIGFERICYAGGWEYMQSPTMAEEFAVVAEYVKASWKEARAPKLAFVGIQSVWGDDPQPEGKKYAQSLGFEILPSEIVPYVVVDATTNLARLKSEGADFVYMQVLPSSLTPTLRDAERMGLLGQMHFIGTETGMGDNVLKMAGAAGEGYLFAMIAPWFDETDNRGIKLMIDKQMEYHGKVVRDNAYRNGWIVGAVACEAIKNAVENVGYDNVDGAAIKEALDNMQDFDINGLVTVAYKDRGLDRRGITKLAIYEVRGGKMVPVTDWRESPSLVPPK